MKTKIILFAHPLLRLFKLQTQGDKGGRNFKRRPYIYKTGRQKKAFRI